MFLNKMWSRFKDSFYIIFCIICGVCYAFTLMVLWYYESCWVVILFLISLVLGYIIAVWFSKIMDVKCFISNSGIGRFIPNFSKKGIKTELGYLAAFCSYLSLSINMVYIALDIIFNGNDSSKLVNIINIILIFLNIFIISLYGCIKARKQYVRDSTIIKEIKNGKTYVDKKPEKHKHKLQCNKIIYGSKMALYIFICLVSIIVPKQHIHQLVGYPSYDISRITYKYEEPIYKNVLKSNTLLFQYRDNHWHTTYVKPNRGITFKIGEIKHYQHKKYYRVNYRNKSWYVDGTKLTNAYYKSINKTHSVKLLRSIITYNHAHFTHYNRKGSLPKGCIVKVKKVINNNGMMRFKLFNGRFITSNKNCVRLINK